MRSRRLPVIAVAPAGAALVLTAVAVMVVVKRDDKVAVPTLSIEITKEITK